MSTPTILAQITAYVVQHQAPSQFMKALLAGEVPDAYSFAPPEAISVMREIMQTLDERVPREARGSYAAVDAWCSK